MTYHLVPILFGCCCFLCWPKPVHGDVDFNRDVRPLLSNYCFQCHGPDSAQREADLRLDIEGDAKRDLGGYAAVSPRDPSASELLVRITSDDPDLRMPPVDTGKQLSDTEVRLLTEWIEQGASWSDHWAYMPPTRHAVPTPVDRTWPLNWVDHFILDRLQREELHPSAAADPVTLVRRLYFDLAGLPPTPTDVAGFVNDQDPTSYERVVDRLLESPHFGERLAMYWLDLVRYADTVGYHGDQDHNISPYRDYVIDAFNRNLPFDQFTREQLAGDLLPNPTVEQRVATGYNRLLQTSHEGGVQPKEYLAIYAADRVRNVSAVWLGATLGCAQCHDHKYDPYTMRDFYAMEAFFADVDEEGHFKLGTNALPTARPPEMDVLSWQDRQQLAQLQEELQRLQTQLEGRAADAELTQRIATLEKERRTIEKRRRRTMVTVALDEPRVVRLLPRGNWLDKSGPVMEPAVPAFLGMASSDRRLSRLDLANWLTDAENGVGLLTARVMVNRLWYLCFGVGLSESLDDFGAQGKPPTHPELLDNLAVEFVESGWDVKQLLKLLVMSRTYRQTSEVGATLRQADPGNLLFARQSRYRLPAEMVRDAALSISGLLVDEYGGESVRPYQPSGYYRHLNFPRRRYAHHADQRQWRRGVYVHWQRQFLHPMLKAFDAPSREECTAQRPRSNTPLAALVLLNDPTFVEAARGLAERVLSLTDANDAERLELAFRYATSRSPDGLEMETLRSFLKAARAEYDSDPAAVAAVLEIGERSATSGVAADELAAWTSVARVVLNLSETTTRQ